MNIDKIIITGAIIMLIAVGYVHQHVEIYKVGYNLQSNRKQLSALVDQNSELMYNLSKLESPGYLLASLDSKEIEFAKRRSRSIDKYQIIRNDQNTVNTHQGPIGRFFDLFTLSAEARPNR